MSEEADEMILFAKRLELHSWSAWCSVYLYLAPLHIHLGTFRVVWWQLSGSSGSILKTFPPKARNVHHHTFRLVLPNLRALCPSLVYTLSLTCISPSPATLAFRHISSPYHSRVLRTFCESLVFESANQLSNSWLSPIHHSIASDGLLFINDVAFFSFVDNFSINGTLELPSSSSLSSFLLPIFSSSSASPLFFLYHFIGVVPIVDGIIWPFSCSHCCPFSV